MARQTTPINMGIIGCGNVIDAYLRVAERLEARGLARIVAVCGREHQRQTLAAKAQIPNFFVDSQALIDSDDVDLIVILTPIPTHSTLAGSALRAGKHVLVEKPLATDLDAASGLLELTRHSAGHLVCAPFTWLSPTFQRIGWHLRQGDVGRIVSARGRYGWSGPDWAEWFYKPGGGAIFDLAVYNIATLTGWLGPVKRVSGMMGTTIPEREIHGRSIPVEVEDNAQILLDFGDSRFAVVTSGFTIQQYRGPSIELYGTAGTIQLLGDDWDPAGFEMWRNSAGHWQCFNETHPNWPWADGLRHLVECVHAGVEPDLRPDHAFHVLEIMLRAKEASRDGKSRAVTSTFVPPVLHAEPPAMEAHRIHDRTRIESH